MNRDLPRRAPQPRPGLRGLVLRRLGRHGGADEGGFILLESLIAISLITVIMAAVGVEFLTGMVSSAHQRAEKKAIALASTSMERIRALHASDLYAGRTQSNAEGERDTLAGISSVTSWIGARTSAAYGPASATNPVPTTADTSTAPYSVYQYLECTGTRNSDGSCNTARGAAANYVRAIVAVTWQQRGCANGTCAYVMSSLINTDQNPQFDDNQPLPPAPVISNSNANQTVEVGDAVSVTMLVSNGTGVPPYLWSEPATPPSGDVALSALGLTLSPAGQITGTLTVSGSPTFPATYKTMIVVTDGLGGRTDTEELTWTVYPQLTLAMNPEASRAGTADSVTLAASGGKPGYTYSDPGSTLPSGVTVSGSQAAGTPSTAGDYQVNLTAKDSLNRTATTGNVRWTVYGLANPATGVEVTEGQNVDQTVTYNCPVASGCTLGLAGSIPGLGLSATASTSNNTSTTLAVSGTGTAHITGRVQATAVTGAATSANYSVSVSIGATSRATYQTPAVTWTADVPPTVSSTATSTSPGSYPSVPVTYSCTNTPCTITLSNATSGIGLSTAVATGAANTTTSLSVSATSGTVYLTGKVGGGTATTTQTLSISDAGAVTATDSDVWTVTTKPVVGFPGIVPIARNGTPSQSLAVNCTNACTVAVSGLPPGVGIGTSATTSANSTSSINIASGNRTVWLSGKVSATAPTGPTTVTVTVTDGARVVSSVGVWTVS